MKRSHTHKFTAEEISEWNKKQLTINLDDYEKDNV